MISIKQFTYKPNEYEAEKASNSYLMSMVALIAGLPLPIINLVASAIFYLGNRKGTYFVRWHCTQALLTQFSLILMNSVGFWWTISIVIGSESITNKYISYFITIFLFNLAEFVATIYSAIKVRNGIHIEWWIFNDLTNLICKP